MHDADSILLALSRATDESEKRSLRDQLLLDHAAPIIRQTLRQRLRVSQSHLGSQPYAASPEDLFNDVIVKLIERLEAVQRRPTTHIRNFAVYVARIATNVCNDYLRNRKRERHLLRHKLRNLLDRHPDFRVWKTENNVIFCSLVTAESRASFLSQPLPPEQVDEIVEKLQTDIFAGNYPPDLPLSKVAAETLTLLGQTVALDFLVEIVALFQGIKDQPLESLDAIENGLSQQLADAAPPSDLLIEGREGLRQYWEEVKRLSTDQRNTICLSFEDEAGEDLFSLLIDAELATVPDLAAELGLSITQFNELWMRLPMVGNAELAEYLGATHQQVSLWRFRAQTRLRKWLISRKK